MGPYDHDRTKVRITQPDHYPLCESPLRDGAVVLVERFTGWHLHIKMMDGSTTMITVDNPRVRMNACTCIDTTTQPPDGRRAIKLTGCFCLLGIGYGVAYYTYSFVPSFT